MLFVVKFFSHFNCVFMLCATDFGDKRCVKLEIRSWGTRGGLQGRVQQLLDMTNSFVTNAVLIERELRVIEI